MKDMGSLTFFFSFFCSSTCHAYSIYTHGTGGSQVKKRMEGQRHNYNVLIKVFAHYYANSIPYKFKANISRTLYLILDSECPCGAV